MFKGLVERVLSAPTSQEVRMSHLTDAELEQLVNDVARSDRVNRGAIPPLVTRITRLLAEARQLREQQAEREFHYHEEGPS
jgi:hypothetical protein